jgi:3-hydroxyacyl-[acyl-carrier-protein] dehydratase
MLNFITLYDYVISKGVVFLLAINEIQDIIIHRYPFLLVDRIIEIEPMKRAVGIKNVTINDWFFQGHFLERPIMPEMLIIEAMSQVGGIAILYPNELRGTTAYTVGIEKGRFIENVVPGDQLRMVAEVIRMRSNMGKIWTQAFVDNELVAEAEIRFALARK